MRFWKKRRIRSGLRAVDWNPDTDTLIVSTDDILDEEEAAHIREFVSRVIRGDAGEVPRVMVAVRLDFTVLRNTGPGVGTEIPS